MKQLSLLILTLIFSVSAYAKTVIAIDAGHGGKDPGAIGKNLGLKEKDVTLSIAKELKALLDKDPNFKGVLTRSQDKFVALPQRTEIARKNRASYLISIHADSSPSSDNLKGASVWVLSNRRANDELGKWLEDHEKQSELLGGAGSVLANNNEKYLNQTVLDLQFSHSQRTGYELGKTILARLNTITPLAKKAPQHASLSVLRSPDIPSILVETGFLSNSSEEQKLASLAYRRQIAREIYRGLVDYRKKNRGIESAKTDGEKTTKTEKTKADKTVVNSKSSSKPNEKSSTAKNITQEKPAKAQQKTEKQTGKLQTKQEKSKTSQKVDLNATFHIVQVNETLYSIARMYNTTPEKLMGLNNIKDNRIFVGKKLKLK